MAFNLTVSTITPPDGLAHTDRKTEIMDLPLYLCVTGATGSVTQKLVHVSDTPPGREATDDVWLKTGEGTIDGVSAHGFYTYVAGTWTLMAGPGVVVGGAVPANTNILWLKTDEVDAILTPGGSAVTALKGFYWFNSTAWTRMDYTPISVGTTAPTDTTRPWLKTDDTTTVRGVYVYDTGTTTWILMAGVDIENVVTPVTAPTNTNKLMVVRDDLDTVYGIGAHVYNATSALWLPAHKGKAIIYQNATPTTAAEKKCLWFRLADAGDMSQGLFYWNGANWKSLTPISIWASFGPASIGAGVATFNIASWYTFPQAFDASPAPFITITMTGDDQPASHLTVGAYSPAGVDITLVGYNAYAGTRTLSANIMATGHQTR